MKRNLMIGLAAVLVIIIVIAAGLLVLNQNNGGGEEHLAVAWSGQYRVGDFVQYQLNPTSNNQTLRYTVVGITPSEIRINSSITSGAASSPGWINYNPEYNVSRNSTFAFGLGHSVKTDGVEQSIDQNISYTGNETISTKWGAKSCEHYNGTEPLGALSYAYDQWTYNGIVVKTIQNGEIWTNGVPETLIISDSNLQEMTGAIPQISPFNLSVGDYMIFTDTVNGSIEGTWNWEVINVDNSPPYYQHDPQYTVREIRTHNDENLNFVNVVNFTIDMLRNGTFFLVGGDLGYYENLGTEIIYTSFGERNCTHYRELNTSSYGYISDVWIGVGNVMLYRTFTTGVFGTEIRELTSSNVIGV